MCLNRDTKKVFTNLSIHMLMKYRSVDGYFRNAMGSWLQKKQTFDYNDFEKEVIYISHAVHHIPTDNILDKLVD